MIYNQIYAGSIYPKIIFDAHLQVKMKTFSEVSWYLTNFFSVSLSKVLSQFVLNFFLFVEINWSNA